MPSPVEWASNQNSVINNNILVVHMSLTLISSNWNALFWQIKNISTLVMSTFIISDKSINILRNDKIKSFLPNFDSSFVKTFNGSGKVIIGDSEDTDIHSLFSHIEVSDQTLFTCFSWEEDSITNTSLWVKETLNNVANDFLKALKEINYSWNDILLPLNLLLVIFSR